MSRKLNTDEIAQHVRVQLSFGVSSSASDVREVVPIKGASCWRDSVCCGSIKGHPAPMEADLDSWWVYFLETEGNLLYVGITQRPFQRVREHRKTKTFDRVYFWPKTFEDKFKAEQIESEIARVAKPSIDTDNAWSIHGCPRASDVS